MASENASNYEQLKEATTYPNTFLMPASCRFIQDISDVFINPLESLSMDIETPLLLKDPNSETPNKYPVAPQSSPIDVQNYPDISVFNSELKRCLSELSLILISSEETKENSLAETSVFYSEDEPKINLEDFALKKSEVKFQEQHETDCEGSLKTSYATKNISNFFARDTEEELKKHFSVNVDKQKKKMEFLTVNTIRDFKSEFYGSSPLRDDESMIANCASDVSDLSLNDVETASSDGNSYNASRHRIEFEALALDSSINPSIFQKFQHWKTRTRSKRALSLDELNLLNILYTSNFELAI